MQALLGNPAVHCEGESTVSPLLTGGTADYHGSQRAVTLTNSSRSSGVLCYDVLRQRGFLVCSLLIVRTPQQAYADADGRWFEGVPLL